MRNLSFLLLALALLVACSNDKKATPQATTSDAHAAHMVVNAGYCDSVNSGLIIEDTMKGSPHRVAMATVETTHVHIEYSSPGVKGRIIWGGLVPYDKVWVTGAHNATSIQFNKEVEIGGKTIAAGQYALFTIPGKEKWVLLINSRYEQHLADEYNEKEDIVRVEVQPQPHELTQRLTYSVERLADNKGVINIDWEKLRVSLPFVVK